MAIKPVGRIEPIKNPKTKIEKPEPVEAAAGITTRPAPIKSKPEPARSRAKTEPQWVDRPKQEFVKVKIETIDDTGYNSRLEIDENDEDFKALCESVRQMGTIEPIILTPLDDLKKNKEGLRFDLVSGFRRFRALKRVKARETWAVIHHYTHPTQRLIVNLLENQHRKNLRVYEEALAFKKLHDEGFRVVTIAEKLSISESKISNYISCAENLIPELLDVLKKNESDATVTQLIGLSRASVDEQRSFYRNLMGQRAAPAADKPPAPTKDKERFAKPKTRDQLRAFLGDLTRAESIDVDGDEVFLDDVGRGIARTAIRWALSEIRSFPLVLPPDDKADRKRSET